MLKTASKNIVHSPNYDLLKIAQHDFGPSGLRPPCGLDTSFYPCNMCNNMCVLPVLCINCTKLTDDYIFQREDLKE